MSSLAHISISLPDLISVSSISLKSSQFDVELAAVLKHYSVSGLSSGQVEKEAII